MTVYWILLVLSAAVGIPMCGLCEKKEGRSAAFYCILTGVILTVISSVRFGVGHDYNLYAGWYYDLNFMNYDDIGMIKQENGLMYLLKLLNTVCVDYPPAFVLISLLIYPPLMYYIYRHSDNSWMSVIAFLGMGLFFNSMNFMRQFIAAVICAFALKYAEKGCLWRFAVLVIFASAFHRSAIVVLPCLIFVYIGWNYVTLAVSLVSSAVLYFCSEPVLRFVTRYFYSVYDVGSSGDMINGLPPRYAVMFGLLFIALFLLRERLEGEKKAVNIIIWCSFLSFFFELIGTKYSIISRLSVLFFIPAVCLGIPKAVQALSALGKTAPREKTIASVCALVILMSVSCGILLYHNYNGVVPYTTVIAEVNGYE